MHRTRLNVGIRCRVWKKVLSWWNVESRHPSCLLSRYHQFVSEDDQFITIDHQEFVCKRFRNRPISVTMRNYYRKYTVSSEFPIMRKTFHTQKVVPPKKHPIGFFGSIIFIIFINRIRYLQSGYNMVYLLWNTFCIFLYYRSELRSGSLLKVYSNNTGGKP